MAMNIYADVSNIYYGGLNKWDRKLDYGKLIDYLSGIADITVKRAYGASMGDEAKGFIHALESQGWDCQWRTPKSYSNGKRKMDWDVGIACDMLTDRPKRCVLLSADGDMTPVVKLLRASGCNVIVMGFQISQELAAEADTAIEIPLSMMEARPC